MSDNRCWECGCKFDRSKPYNGHEGWCDQGIQEEEWIEDGLTQFDKDMGWGLRFDSDGRPSLYDTEEENDAELAQDTDTGVWYLVK